MINYKAGDKIKCISLPTPGVWFDNNPITVGKLYVAQSISADIVHLYNDLGKINGYYSKRFVRAAMSKNIHVL